MIKKTVLCLIAIMLIFSATACGSSSSVPVSDNVYADYVGCQFSGTDPWGGSLSVTVRSIVNGKTEWTFTDSFDDHTLYQEIKGTDIREGTAEFDIKGRDVEHKEVSFAYQGSLELQDEQMIMTLDSGAVNEGSSLTRSAESLAGSGPAYKGNPFPRF